MLVNTVKHHAAENKINNIFFGKLAAVRHRLHQKHEIFNRTNRTTIKNHLNRFDP